jgi:hypothetical protein
MVSGPNGRRKCSGNKAAVSMCRYLDNIPDRLAKATASQSHWSLREKRHDHD